MFRRYFAIIFATGIALAFITVLFSDTPAQTQNNLAPSSSGALKPAGSATKTAAPAGPTSDATAEPDYPDPTTVRSLSDDELNGLFDRMSSHFSRDAVLFNNVGAAFFLRQQYDKAEAAIRHAIALNGHPAFLTNLSIVYETENRVPEAINAVQRAVNQAPRYARGRAQLCELMLTARRIPDTVLCYEEMGKIVTLDAASQTYYSVALLRAGQAQKAIDLVTPLASGSQPTALMFNVLGGAYFAKKRYKQASEAFKRGVEIDPDSPHLRYNLAMALSATDNRAGAMSQYDLMKDKDPKLADQLYRTLYRDKITFVDDQTAKRP